MIDGLIRLMNSPDDLTGPINLGNPEEITILELADKIIKLAASRSEIIFKPLPADDPRQRKPDITLAKEKLGWSPWTSLEEGLEKTIRYYDKTTKCIKKNCSF
jgi:UDP-glucuronate decarboxylase